MSHDRTIVTQPSFTEVLEGFGEEDPENDYEGESRWARPHPPKLDPQSDQITFQQIDIDCEEVYNATSLQMFGMTETGHSVLAHIMGFEPYFYVLTPRGFQERDLDAFKDALNDTLQKPLVVRTEAVLRQFSLLNGNPNVRFIKVTVQHQCGLAEVKDNLHLFKDVFIFRTLPLKKEVYEDDIPFILRFMVDTKTVGMNWIEVPAGAYQLVADKKSHCQIELTMRWDAFTSHEPEGQWSRIAPLRVLSFDIECLVRGTTLPEPRIDSVIQIANIVTQFGAKTVPYIRNVFTLGTCAEISGAQVVECEDESDLLVAWREFVEEVDPDIIIGYNIAHFDLPFLHDRAETLGIAEFPYLGRLKGVKTRVEQTDYYVTPLVPRKAKETRLHGRLQIDLYQYIRREHSGQVPASYSLNSVSKHFLEEGKEDLHFSQITGLQNGTPQTRRQLAIYCLKDTYLPHKLLHELRCVEKYVKQAQTTGVPFNHILSRGRPAQEISQRYRVALNKNYMALPPASPQ